MNEPGELVECFERNRRQLQTVAYRMLGSASEAEDAVQETWLRLARVDAGEVGNIAGWLRTVLTRICLDMLRSRKLRREDVREHDGLDQRTDPPSSSGPEDAAIVADSVSRALLVVLNTLEPTERIAFVLHDMFAVPFDQIAPILERTPVAAKKLASRARHKVQGSSAVPAAELARHRRVIAAFLTAARAGDLYAILAVLAPDVVRRADPAALPPGAATELHGARPVAEGTVALAGRTQYAELALVNGAVGIIVAPHGQLLYALSFTVVGETITAYDVIAEPTRLQRVTIAVLT